MTAVTHALATLPPGARPAGVTARPAVVEGRPCVRVELPDETTLYGRPGVDFIDQPTFLRVPAGLATGTVAVDVWSRLNGKGPDDARAFAGLAYRIGPRCKSFESVYLRPLNGLKVDPQPPRDRRALQYFSYPEWPFDRLREAYPDGRYETGLAIGPEEWTRLELRITTDAVVATVNGLTALAVERPLGRVMPGDVGLFVDIGTEAFFADLVIDVDTDVE